MSLQKMKPWTQFVRGAACAAMCVVLAPNGFAQISGPFATMAGSWTGTGTITMKTGASERIRCRASYFVSPSGTNLRQNLRCASDSYKFEVKSDIIYQGGAVSGTWSELTRQASGKVSGRINGGEIETVVDGTGFTASLSVSTRGDKQSVSIRPQGVDVTAVSINLSKS